MNERVASYAGRSSTATHFVYNAALVQYYSTLVQYYSTLVQYYSTLVQYNSTLGLAPGASRRPGSTIRYISTGHHVPRA
eukprot:1267720-Rhodomonas_salina.1